MTTRVDALEPVPRPAPVTWQMVAADFGRLLGRAVALAIAVGLLLTAATLALPATPTPSAKATPVAESLHSFAEEP